MKFKKIYIEITNKCNLNCSFCSIDDNIKKELSLSEFEHILKNIDNYTNYIYLHVKGEPLLHTKFKEILELANKYNKNVNITTNGTLLKNRVEDIIKSNTVRQINISCQSINNIKIIGDILESSELLIKNNIIVVLRFWTLKNNTFNVFEQSILDKIIEYYNLDESIINKIKTDSNIKLKENLYLNKDIEFRWPNINDSDIDDAGYCYGLKSHIGILVDGTVIPCCLDSKGIINLGNIFKTTLTDILKNKRTEKMKIGFQNKKIVEDLCKKCNYRKRFK